jgi:hypothetical protein
MRSGYRELGLELVSLEEEHSHQPKNLPWKKKREMNGAGDPIKLLLEESLTQQRNEMMDNFT